MKRKISFLFLIAVLSTEAFGYEVQLHARMTRKAFDAAANQNDFLKNLGMKTEDKDVARERMAQGAINEDDTFSIDPIRVKNHFFDPLESHSLQPLTIPNDRSISGGCILKFKRADLWALDHAQGNEFDLQSAKDHLIHTVTDLNGSNRSDHQHSLFESLGHICHLVEDMAQPEHTRNDQHLYGSHLFIGSDTAASVWEGWSAEHFTNAPEEFFEGYPVVKLPDYGNYFHDADGRGMADYSNRNFFTQDTNENDERPDPPEQFKKCYYYSSPTADRTRTHSVTVKESYYVAGALTSGDVFEIEFDGTTYDAYTGYNETDGAQTVASLLDFDTRIYGVQTFSLSDTSYFSRGAFLLPRAVGYAAGFVDRFFAPRINAIWAKNDDGTWNITIENKSADKAIGSNAQIEAIYVPGAHYLGNENDEDSSPIVWGTFSTYVPNFSGIPPLGSVTLRNVTVPTLKAGDSLMQFERRMVIIGTFGSEAGAVIPLVQPKPSGPIRAEIDVPIPNHPTGGYVFTPDFSLLCNPTPDQVPCTFPGVEIINPPGWWYINPNPSEILPPGSNKTIIKINPLYTDGPFNIMGGSGCLGCHMTMVVSQQGQVIYSKKSDGQFIRLELTCEHDSQTCTFRELKFP